MVDEVHKRVVAEILAEGADEAIKEAQKFRAEVDAVKEAMVELGITTQQRFKDISMGIERASKDMKLSLKNLEFEFGKGVLSQALTETEQQWARVAQGFTGMALDPWAQAAGGFTGMFSNLNAEVEKSGTVFTKFGKILSGVFIGMIGFRIFQVFGNFIDKLREATEKAEQFTREVQQMEIGVRALQRSGMDTTLEEWRNELDRLAEKFPSFTDQQLNNLLESVANLTREFGFTKQEMFDLAEITASLALKTGDLDDALAAVLGATTKQYTKAIADYGISLSEVQIKNEAYRLGLAETGEELDKNQKAAATLSLIRQQFALVEEDLITLQETQVGQLTQSRTELENLQTTIGEGLIPVKLAWYRVILMLINVWTKFIDLTSNLGVILYTNLVAPFIAATAILKSFRDGVSLTFEDMLNIVGTTMIMMKTELEKIKFLGEDDDPLFGDAPIGTPEAIRENGEEILLEIEDVIDEIEDEWSRYQSRRKDAEIDFYRDLEEITRREEDKRKEIIIDNLLEIEEIERKTQDKILVANQKFDLDLQQLQRDHNEKQEDINEKYREKELNSERDFQEKLRRLREEFLFDLEDALRERDARQVLRLMKRFELDKSRLSRERASEQEERNLRKAAELQDLEDRRKLREQKLREDHALRIQQIKQQKEFELREQQIAFDAELEELQRQTEIRRREREIDFNNQLEDLDRHTRERLAKIVEGFIDETEITSQGIQDVMDALAAGIGPGGTAEQLYNYYLQLLQNVVTATAQIMSSLGAQPEPVQVENYEENPELRTHRRFLGRYAEGGIAVARTPSMLMFGDKGPEAAVLTPLNRVGRNEGRVFGGSMPGGSMSDQRMKLELWLSPDLEARIVDKSMGEVADVVMRRLP